MKRLRRFNESKSDIDYDYVYQCFAELLDDERAEIKLIERDSVSMLMGDQTEPYITITLKTIVDIDHKTAKTSNLIGDQNSSIYNHIENHNTNNELLQEVKVSLKRLSDKYPDYKLQFSEYRDYIFIEIFKNKKERRRAF